MHPPLQQGNGMQNYQQIMCVDRPKETAIFVLARQPAKIAKNVFIAPEGPNATALAGEGL